MSISKEQIKNALKNSGYLLEDRVNKILGSLNWDTIPNTRYKDDLTGIEREIDIFALLNVCEIEEHLDHINSSLLIECMNNKEPVAFFENLPKQPNRIAALNFNVFNENFWNILSWAQKELNSEPNLIYSSQYCSFQQVQSLKKEFNEGWIAMHPNEKHDSLNSLFKYIKYHKEQFKNMKNTSGSGYISGFYYRPLVVLQGELISVEQSHDILLHEREHIKYQIPKTDNDGRYFTIDIITENYLQRYLNYIAEEDKVIAKMINKHREKLIEEIVA